MSVTRPTGEQITFTSSKTGTHNLDTYLENVEKGTRTLEDMLNDLFYDTTSGGTTPPAGYGVGDLRADFFEIRENPSTAGVIEYRIGQYVSSSVGWVSITDMNTFTAAAAAQVSVAAGHASAALLSANAALTSQNAAAGSASAASSSASSAATSYGNIINNTSFIAVSNSLTDITTLATSPNLANVAVCATDLALGAASLIKTVGSYITDVSTVAADIQAVRTISTTGFQGQMSTLYADLIAGGSTNVTGKMNACFTNMTTITSVANNLSSIGSVHTNMSSVTAINNVLGQTYGGSIGIVGNDLQYLNYAGYPNSSTSNVSYIQQVGINIADVIAVGSATGNLVTLSTDLALGSASILLNASTTLTTLTDVYRVGPSSNPPYGGNSTNSAPNAVNGSMWYETTNNRLKHWDSSVSLWQDFAYDANLSKIAAEGAFTDFDNSFRRGTTANRPSWTGNSTFYDGYMYSNTDTNSIDFWDASLNGANNGGWYDPLAASAASAAAAATSESNASTSESNASTSASNASTSESNASTSASNASTSESNAATSESNASTSASNAAASFDNFDDRYLGAKSSPPTLDNDGNTLLVGAMYFNSTGSGIWTWTGTSWIAAGAYTLPASVVHDTEKGALHATDALRISGHSVQLYKGDGTYESVTVPDNNTTYSNATTSSSGLMSSTDKTKLNGVDSNANQYVHPNHSGDVVSSADGATTIQSGAVDLGMLSASGTASGSTFLRGDNTWATPTDTDTVYTHPTGSGNTHLPVNGSAGQILVNTGLGQAGWAAAPTQYSHPTTAGYKHIPSGGSSGDILGWSSSGTATWGAPATAAGGGGSATGTLGANSINISGGWPIVSTSSGWEAAYGALVAPITPSSLFSIYQASGALITWDPRNSKRFIMSFKGGTNPNDRIYSVLGKVDAGRYTFGTPVVSSGLVNCDSVQWQEWDPHNPNRIAIAYNYTSYPHYRGELAIIGATSSDGLGLSSSQSTSGGGYYTQPYTCSSSLQLEFSTQGFCYDPIVPDLVYLIQTDMYASVTSVRTEIHAADLPSASGGNIVPASASGNVHTTSLPLALWTPDTYTIPVILASKVAQKHVTSSSYTGKTRLVVAGLTTSGVGVTTYMVHHQTNGQIYFATNYATPVFFFYLNLTMNKFVTLKQVPNHPDKICLMTIKWDSSGASSVQNKALVIQLAPSGSNSSVIPFSEANFADATTYGAYQTSTIQFGPDGSYALYAVKYANGTTLHKLIVAHDGAIYPEGSDPYHVSGATKDNSRGEFGISEEGHFFCVTQDGSWQSVLNPRFVYSTSMGIEISDSSSNVRADNFVGVVQQGTGNVSAGATITVDTSGSTSTLYAGRVAGTLTVGGPAYLQSDGKIYSEKDPSGRGALLGISLSTTSFLIK